MDCNGLFLEIYKHLSRRYSHISEICRMTQELGDSISRDDQVSIHIIIEMRGEEMDKADDCHRAIMLLTDNLPPKEKAFVERCLNTGDSSGIQGEFYGKIAEISGNIRSVLSRCIEIDKVISCRTGGDQSFYMN